MRIIKKIFKYLGRAEGMKNGVIVTVDVPIKQVHIYNNA